MYLAGVTVCSSSQQNVQCFKTDLDGIHQPSTKIESPVLVLMVFGFLTVCQGNWGKAFRFVNLPRSCCLKLFF